MTPRPRSWGRGVARVLGGIGLLLATLVAWQWTADVPLDVLKTRWASGASRFVDVDGMSVHYRDEGSGPAILLLHGTGASLHTWDAWTSVLTAAGWRVVRLDLPAFGLTGPNPRDDYRVDTYVDFLEHFAAQRGLEHFALGGNSFGGTLAWRYAAAHPSQVSALVLVDAGGFPRAGRPPLAFRLGGMPLVGSLMEHLEPRWVVAKTLRQSYGDPSRVTPELIGRYRDMVLRPGNRAAFGKRTATPFEDHTSELRRVSMPVLILWGAEDHLIPVADARRFAAAIPGAQVRIYSGLGHVPMEEDGARTAADVHAFLTKLPR